MTKKISGVVIFFSLLLTVNISLGQKQYKINNTTWTYAIPENYKIRVDNFSSLIKKGDSVIRQNAPEVSISDDDKILISAAKSDSSNLNIILADYKSNSNIKKFTLKGYVSKLVGFLKYSYEKNGSNVTIDTKEIIIDTIKFTVVETKIYDKDKNYTYWTSIYIAELGDKELNISVIYDNENDKKIIEQSIVKSKFSTK